MIKITKVQAQRIDRLCSIVFAMDDKWITVKPNGEKGKGSHVKIDGEGRVVAGMGGKFNGTKINEVRKDFKGPKTPSGDVVKANKVIEHNIKFAQHEANKAIISRLDEDQMAENKKSVESNKLDRLISSLSKKNEKFDSMLKNHFETVKQANGQPLNDKRNGTAALKKWDQQANSLNKQAAEIEKTERAIEREKEIIAKIESTNLPSPINEAIQSGEITQWRKYPNRFFVKGVEKGRMIWDEKKGQLLNSHYSEIPEEQKPIFKDAYFKLKAKLEGRSSADVQKENDDKIRAKQEKKAAEEAKRKALHESIKSLFKKSMSENASPLKTVSEPNKQTGNILSSNEKSGTFGKPVKETENAKLFDVDLEVYGHSKPVKESIWVPKSKLDEHNNVHSDFLQNKMREIREKYQGGVTSFSQHGSNESLSLQSSLEDKPNKQINVGKSHTYLNVPFREKEVAKKFGAKWDAVKKKWYIPEGKELPDGLRKYATDSALSHSERIDALYQRVCK